MSVFQRALAKALVHEGGYVNHPKDPGGATNFGITQRVYDDYRRSADMRPQSVKLISTAERDTIYRTRYWALVTGDSLPPGVSYIVFDGAVNSGVAQSVKWLRRARQCEGRWRHRSPGTRSYIVANDRPFADQVVSHNRACRAQPRCRK